MPETTKYIFLMKIMALKLKVKMTSVQHPPTVNTFHIFTACLQLATSTSILYILSVPLLSPACLPVRQLPIPPPWRPNILALHKFLMSVRKSPATSTHWWFNLLQQTNTTAYTCFCTFLTAFTSHM